MPQKKKQTHRVIKGSIRPWYRWHRRVGVTSAVFVIILAVTGLILNHNIMLDLHNVHITNPWLLEWYGYDADAEYAKEVLTLDKLILDIHTGRVLGGVGSFIMDIAAILFLVLALSGVYMWYLRSPKKHKVKSKK
jgi:hypothetical protein